MAKHPEESIKQLIRFIPKVGKFLDKMATGINNLHEKIEKFKTEINANSEESKLLAFLDKIEGESFSIYENDIITELIRQMLNPKGKKRQNVLIIDNLDRIDPEHIFRILNIFSAHMDYHKDHGDTNKFYFDKVIMVCDINNIRNIFKNKYGAGVDFSGYIDKFYSKEIFYFQNYPQIAKTCHTILRQLRIGKSVATLNLMNKIADHHGVFNLVTALVNTNQVSLRQLFNFCETPLFFPKEFSVTVGDSEDLVEIWNTPILEMLILSKLVSGFEQLYEIMNDLKNDLVYVSDFQGHFQCMLYFDLRHLHKFHSISIKETQLIINGETLLIDLETDRNHCRNMKIGKHTNVGAINYKPTLTDYYFLYLKILKEFYINKVIE